MLHPCYLSVVKKDGGLLERLEERFASAGEEFDDPEVLQDHVREDCAKRVISVLHLPKLPVRLSGGDQTVLPIVLAVLRHGIGAPVEHEVRDAAKQFLELVIRSSGVDWTNARLRVELEQPGIGFQDFYRLEQTRGQTGYRITQMGGKGPLARLRADHTKLVHLVCERGVLCLYRGCHGRRGGKCPQADYGCTRDASDDTIAALSLLLVPLDRFAEAIRLGKRTVPAVIALEAEAVKKARGRKGISRANRKGKASRKRKKAARRD